MHMPATFNHTVCSAPSCPHDSAQVLQLPALVVLQLNARATGISDENGWS
jgi:hypothetical protein